MNEGLAWQPNLPTQERLPTSEVFSAAIATTPTYGLLQGFGRLAEDWGTRQQEEEVDIRNLKAEELYRDYNEEQADYLLKAESMVEFQNRKERLAEDLQNRKLLADSGITGMGLTLAVNIFDPVSMGITAVSFGTAGLTTSLAKTAAATALASRSRIASEVLLRGASYEGITALQTGGTLARVAKGAAAGTVENLIADRVSQFGKSVDEGDMLFSALAGAVLGGVVGALSKDVSQAAKATVGEGAADLENGHIFSAEFLDGNLAKFHDYQGNTQADVMNSDLFSTLNLSDDIPLRAQATNIERAVNERDLVEMQRGLTQTPAAARRKMQVEDQTLTKLKDVEKVLSRGKKLSRKQRKSAIKSRDSIAKKLETFKQERTRLKTRDVETEELNWKGLNQEQKVTAIKGEVNQAKGASQIERLYGKRVPLEYAPPKTTLRHSREKTADTISYEDMRRAQSDQERVLTPEKEAQMKQIDKEFEAEVLSIKQRIELKHNCIIGD